MNNKTKQSPKISIDNFTPYIYSAFEYSRQGLPATIHSQEIFLQIEQSIINSIDQILQGDQNSQDENKLLLKIKYLPKIATQKRTIQETKTSTIYQNIATQLIHSPKIAQQGIILLSRDPFFITSNGDLGVNELALYIDSKMDEMEQYQKEPRINGLKDFVRPLDIKKVIIIDTQLGEDTSVLDQAAISSNILRIYATPVDLSPEQLEKISKIVSPQKIVKKTVKAIRRMFNVLTKF